MADIRYLLENGLAKIARLPPMNDYLLDDETPVYGRLDSLVAYTVPIAGHDYTAKTPVMWNTVYQELGLPIRNIMLITGPSDLQKVIAHFREDPKYLGGGVGVGLKDKVIPLLDDINPKDLKSVNCIVKESGKLVGYNTDALGFVKSLEDKLNEFGKSLKGANIVGFGAGGVAKEVYRLIAQRGASYLVIVNRTRSKATELADDLNRIGATEFIGVGEDLIRAVSLNTIKQPDAFINVTDKGSDGPLVKDTCFAPSGEYNVSFALDNVLRPLKTHHPKTVIADITLPKGAWPATLHWAQVAGFPKENLLNGIPMVINQAAPAYSLIQKAFPQYHTVKMEEHDILAIMKRAAQ